MVDFTNAQSIKNHKLSFDAAILSVHNHLKEISKEYNDNLRLLLAKRKEMNMLIMDIENILKSKNISYEYSLKTMSNENLNHHIKLLIEQLDFETRDLIDVNLVKINNRNKEIIEIGSILESLSEDLNDYYVKEDDLEDEVVLNIEDFVNENNNNQINEEDEVVSTHMASFELINKVKENTTQRKNFSLDFFNLFSDNDKSDEHIFYETHGNSLNTLSKNVFEKEEYASYIYNYSDNKDIIDEYFIDRNLNFDNLYDTPLSDITIKIPLKIEVYQPINKEGKAKAA